MPQRSPSLVAVAMSAMLLMAACGGGGAPTVKPSGSAAPTQTAGTTGQPTGTAGASPTASQGGGGFQIPDIEQGKFNVAMVLIGPHNDGGWSQAHYEGLQYLCENMPESHIAYIENVPEGADSEQVFRSLSRKGFNFVIGT